jgi:GAF domain-containing protein
VRDALSVIHQQSLELIVRGAPMDAVLDALCDGIDALDRDLISSVLLVDPDGQQLWPKAGRRVPDDYKRLISPLPIAPAMAACGTAAFRKERVITPDIATDPLWSGPAEKYRRIALQHGLRTALSVPIVSESGELLGTFGLHHAQSKSVGKDDIPQRGASPCARTRRTVRERTASQAPRRSVSLIPHPVSSPAR